jgi:predicted transcriptional regulator
MPRHIQPSDLELQVLSVLWDQGPCRVHDVRDALPDQKHRAYTTVLAVLQSLERKKLVGHTRDGNANVYAAKVKRDSVLEPLMKRMLRHVFAGRASDAVAALIASDRIDDAELAQIQQLINDYRQSRQEGKS